MGIRFPKKRGWLVIRTKGLLSIIIWIVKNAVFRVRVPWFSHEREALLKDLISESKEITCGRLLKNIKLNVLIKTFILKPTKKTVPRAI